MWHWLHHLFNPHCPVCEAKPKCESCDMLRSMLATEQHQKQLLLTALLEYNKPHIEIRDEQPEKKLEPIRTTNFVPWRVRQEMAEAEDRRAKQILDEQKRQEEAFRAEAERIKTNVDKLEEEIGIKQTGTE